MANLMLELFLLLKWMSVLIIYDQDSISRYSGIFDLLPNDVVRLEVEYKNTSELDWAFSHMDTRRNQREFNIIVLCSAQHIEDVLTQGSEYEKSEDSFTSFKHRSRWLLFSNQSQMVNFSHMTLDHVTFIDPDRLAVNDNRLTIETLMWRENRHRELSQSQVQINDLTLDDIFPNVKFGMNGKVLRVVTKVWPPYTMKKIVNNETVFSGFCMELLDIFADTLNFSYTISLSPDDQWGFIDQGKWTGLIGSLVRKEADLMVAAIAISKDREEVMDFMFPYLFNHGVAMFTLRKDPVDEKWETLLKPFSGVVLACIGVSLILAGLIYHFIEQCNPYYIKPPNLSFWTRIEYLYGALLAHGCGNLPDDLAGRVLVGFWWLFCIILAASYSGTLIATLTVNIDKYPFETLTEMLQQDQYIWGAVDKTLFIPLFRDSSSERLQGIWNGIVKFNQSNPLVLSTNHTDHYHLLKSQHYVFLSEQSIYESFADCQLKTLKDQFFSLKFAFGLQNNSPYTGRFSELSLMLFESHIVETLKKKWWPKEQCSESNQVSSKEIDLASLQSVFYFLLVGLFLATVTLVIEVVSFVKCKHLFNYSDKTTNEC